MLLRVIVLSIPLLGNSILIVSGLLGILFRKKCNDTLKFFYMVLVGETGVNSNILTLEYDNSKCITFSI